MYRFIISSIATLLLVGFSGETFSYSLSLRSPSFSGEKNPVMILVDEGDNRKDKEERKREKARRKAEKEAAKQEQKAEKKTGRARAGSREKSGRTRTGSSQTRSGTRAGNRETVRPKRGGEFPSRSKPNCPRNGGIDHRPPSCLVPTVGVVGRTQGF